MYSKAILVLGYVLFYVVVIVFGWLVGWLVVLPYSNNTRGLAREKQGVGEASVKGGLWRMRWKRGLG